MRCNKQGKKWKFLKYYDNYDKYDDLLLSGDDSVTLPDSTQPEEPVGRIEKEKQDNESI